MRTDLRTVLALAVLAGAAAGCTGEGYRAKDFTADDLCRSCESGGVFSGGDGRFTVLGGTGKKKLNTDEREDRAE